jgi:hypothetical protein
VCLHYWKNVKAGPGIMMHVLLFGTTDAGRIGVATKLG